MRGCFLALASCIGAAPGVESEAEAEAESVTLHGGRRCGPTCTEPDAGAGDLGAELPPPIPACPDTEPQPYPYAEPGEPIFAEGPRSDLAPTPGAEHVAWRRYHWPSAGCGLCWFDLDAGGTEADCAGFVDVRRCRMAAGNVCEMCASRVCSRDPYLPYRGTSVAGACYAEPSDGQSFYRPCGGVEPMCPAAAFAALCP